MLQVLTQFLYFSVFFFFFFFLFQSNDAEEKPIDKAAAKSKSPTKRDDVTKASAADGDTALRRSRRETFGRAPPIFRDYHCAAVEMSVTEPSEVEEEKRREKLLRPWKRKSKEKRMVLKFLRRRKATAVRTQQQQQRRNRSKLSVSSDDEPLSRLRAARQANADAKRGRFRLGFTRTHAQPATTSAADAEKKRASLEVYEFKDDDDDVTTFPLKRTLSGSPTTAYGSPRKQRATDSASNSPSKTAESEAEKESKSTQKTKKSIEKDRKKSEKDKVGKRNKDDENKESKVDKSSQKKRKQDIEKETIADKKDKPKTRRSATIKKATPEKDKVEKQKDKENGKQTESSETEKSVKPNKKEDCATGIQEAIEKASERNEKSSERVEESIVGDSMDTSENESSVSRRSNRRKSSKPVKINELLKKKVEQKRVRERNQRQGLEAKAQGSTVTIARKSGDSAGQNNVAEKDSKSVKQISVKKNIKVKFPLGKENAQKPEVISERIGEVCLASEVRFGNRKLPTARRSKVLRSDARRKSLGTPRKRSPTNIPLRKRLSVDMKAMPRRRSRLLLRSPPKLRSAITITATEAVKKLRKKTKKSEDALQTATPAKDDKVPTTDIQAEKDKHDDVRIAQQTTESEVGAGAETVVGVITDESDANSNVLSTPDKHADMEMDSDAVAGHNVEEPDSSQSAHALVTQQKSPGESADEVARDSEKGEDNQMEVSSCDQNRVRSSTKLEANVLSQEVASVSALVGSLPKNYVDDRQSGDNEQLGRVDEDARIEVSPAASGGEDNTATAMESKQNADADDVSEIGENELEITATDNKQVSEEKEENEADNREEKQDQEVDQSTVENEGQGEGEHESVREETKDLGTSEEDVATDNTSDDTHLSNGQSEQVPEESESDVGSSSSSSDTFVAAHAQESSMSEEPLPPLSSDEQSSTSESSRSETDIDAQEGEESGETAAKVDQAASEEDASAKMPHNSIGKRVWPAFSRWFFNTMKFHCFPLLFQCKTRCRLLHVTTHRKTQHQRSA